MRSGTRATFPFYYTQLAPFDYTWRSGIVSRLGLDMSPEYWRALADRFGFELNSYQLPKVGEAQTAAEPNLMNGAGLPASAFRTHRQEQVPASPS